MKKGDRVACIVGRFYQCGMDIEKYYNPKKGDHLTVDEVISMGSGTYLSFVEIPYLDEDGETACYNSKGFRKLKTDGRNKLSQELAHKVTWEEMVRNPELQGYELNPRKFTTKEKF